MGFGKDGKGVIIRTSHTASLGAVAAGVAVAFKTTTPTEDFRMLKTEMFAGVNGVDAGEGEGLLIGMANADLTVTEIEEALEVNGPLGPQSRIETEKAERAVFILGVVQAKPPANVEIVFVDKHSNAPAIINKTRWTYYSSVGWKYFVYNASAAALATGGNLYMIATHYGVWLI